MYLQFVRDIIIANHVRAQIAKIWPLYIRVLIFFGFYVKPERRSKSTRKQSDATWG
jgi:hypothetical protein